jgi:ribosomal protein L37AE/L43A
MGDDLVRDSEGNIIRMKTEIERKCPNCKKQHLDRGLTFWVCLKCHYAESIATGRVDHPGNPVRMKSLPNDPAQVRRAGDRKQIDG